MPLDAAALKTALQQTAQASPDGLEHLHTLLCRREAGAFQRAAKASGDSGEELLVACTQERRLFLELNAQTEGAAPLDVRPIRFVNIRETGGWSRDAKTATPKIAALIAAAQAPAPQPVPNVSYRFSFDSRRAEAKGTRVAFDGIGRFDLEGGRIKRYSEVFDRGMALAQQAFEPERLRKIALKYATALKARPEWAGHVK